ncbi:MAG: SEL1-like repeat protein, partial [Muribaculaceae bacterium]|nr:SEL1-like repeat protein [Muribaculaceae bacterium]
GDDVAQYLLGLSYYVGRGVAQEDREAVKWLRKAAEQGHADAKKMLEIMGY